MFLYIILLNLSQNIADMNLITIYKIQQLISNYITPEPTLGGYCWGVTGVFTFMVAL